MSETCDARPERGVMTLTDFLLARIAEDEARDIATAIRLGTESPNGGRRWLAECEAKRQIVRAHQEQRDHSRALAEAPTVPEVVLTHAAVGMAMAELSVRHLATVYADHADYRDEWRP